MDEKIDFVIAWVDGGDENWIKQKNKYKRNSDANYSNSAARYRDWEQLKYWFRGVEKYAPWVNNIYFVTCGQTPNWLDTTHPKLKLVNHKDYIPNEFLPTFSANPIELNFHRIEGLSEQFVYFNDDMFLINPVKKTDFFKKGLPCDNYVEAPLRMYGSGDTFPYMLVNNSEIINRYFNKRQSIKKNPFDFINLKYGLVSNMKTICMMMYEKYSGFETSHIPSSLLKSTYENVWEKEGDWLNDVSANKFRTKNDVNQYVFKFWQLCSHNFFPRRRSFGDNFTISDNNTKIIKAIKGKKYRTICINDSDDIKDFESAKKEINMAFEYKFIEKSSFEK